MALEINRITSSSFKIINETGLEKLTLRALAAELDVQAPSLYWHIKNKNELLNLLAVDFFQRALNSVSDDLQWRQWLESYGKILYKQMLQQRDSALLCTYYSPSGDDANARFRAVSQPMVNKGLSRKKALMYVGSVVALATGWVQNQQQAGVRESLSRIVSLDKCFATGLKALVNGFPD